MDHPHGFHKKKENVRTRGKHPHAPPRNKNEGILMFFFKKMKRPTPVAVMKETFEEEKEKKNAKIRSRMEKCQGYKKQSNSTHVLRNNGLFLALGVSKNL